MNPKITVVTVVYNGFGTIEKTIQSVVNQTYSSIEYIVVDGGSTDGSVEIIKKYESGISAWKSEKDSGIYHAMNKGVDMATGDRICFLNCGDVFTDNTVVQRIVESAGVSPGPDVVYGNIFVENSDGTLKERIAKEPCNIHRMYFCHQSAFVKTAVLRKYPFDERYKMSADLKFFKQCHYGGHSFAHLNFPVVIYDTTGLSNVQREKGLRDNIAVIREIERGFDRYLFMLRLYFVIYWRKLNGKDKQK